MPLTKPRRAGAIWGRMAVATSTMMAPPDSPDRKRQTKYQLVETGNAQAKNAAVAATISQRSAWRLDSRAAIGRPNSAPAK
ncbi:hypothetical protein D3C87_1213990 [compost metagenome]